MSVKEFEVYPCDRTEIRDFIETWHYSGSINGVRSDYCFKLTRDGDTIGACIFGKMAMANQWRKYGDSEDDVIELRRLCCVDDTPKNTESYFIGKCNAWLAFNTDIKTVVSYADPFYGHEGIIYQATNFKKVGKTSAGRVIMFNGRRYHDKTIRTYYKGKLKPFAQRVKDALENGEAYYVKTPGKIIYTFDLTNHKRRKARVRVERPRLTSSLRDPEDIHAVN